MYEFYSPLGCDSYVGPVLMVRGGFNGGYQRRGQRGYVLCSGWLCHMLYSIPSTRQEEENLPLTGIIVFQVSLEIPRCVL